MTDDTTTEAQRKFCDLTLSRATELMHEEGGASVQMILDRLLTYSAAQSCVIDPDGAARMFRHIADQIEAGKFAHLEGKTDRRQKH